MSHKLTQTSDIERFLFIGNDEQVRMELWLKGCPEPSVTLNLDVMDAMNIKQALDSVLRQMGKIE
jgi:hypothetical protein